MQTIFNRAFGLAVSVMLLSATGAGAVSSAEPALRSAKTTVSEQHKYYSIEVDYPKFLSNDPDVAAVNAAIKAEVTKRLAQERPVFAKIKKGSPGGGESLYDYSCGSEIQLAQKDLISVTFECEELTDTMPHPSHYSFSMNFQLHPYSKLTLDKLFLPKSGYLQKISSFCRADLKKQSKDNGVEISNDDLDMNLPVKLDSFRTFALHKNGIEFFFDQGAVLDYVTGEVSVVVPWRVLRPMLIPGTPVAKLAK